MVEMAHLYKKFWVLSAGREGQQPCYFSIGTFRYVGMRKGLLEVGCPETQLPPRDLPVAAPREQGEDPRRGGAGSTPGVLWPAGSLLGERVRARPRHIHPQHALNPYTHLMNVSLQFSWRNSEIPRKGKGKDRTSVREIYKRLKGF